MHVMFGHRPSVCGVCTMLSYRSVSVLSRTLKAENKRPRDKGFRSPVQRLLPRFAAITLDGESPLSWTEAMRTGGGIAARRLWRGRNGRVIRWQTYLPASCSEATRNSGCVLFILAFFAWTLCKASRFLKKNEGMVGIFCVTVRNRAHLQRCVHRFTVVFVPVFMCCLYLCLGVSAPSCVLA